MHKRMTLKPNPPIFILGLFLCLIKPLAAQSVSGSTYIRIDDSTPYSILYTIEVRHKNLVNYDDSLTIAADFGITRTTHFKKEKLPDSSWIFQYTYTQITTTTGNFPAYFWFSYNDYQDTLTLYARTDIRDPLGPKYYSSPQFLSPFVYWNPQEDLCFNLFKTQPVYSVYDTVTYDFIFSDTLTHHQLNLDKNTGSICLTKGNIHQSTNFFVWATSTPRYTLIRSHQPLAITLISDTMLPGRFAVDQEMKDSKGFLWYYTSELASQSFSFSYVDSTADSINVNTYSPLFNIGSHVQTSVVKQQDTFNIGVSFPISEFSKFYFPLPVNFEVIPYSQGLVGKTRLISFAVSDRSLTDIWETTINDLNGSLYPNPSTGVFTLTGFPNQNLTSIIRDINGRVVYQSTSTSTIDLSNQPQGLYVLHLTDAQGKLVGIKKLSIIR
jgi:hypothetical protein